MTRSTRRVAAWLKGRGSAHLDRYKKQANNSRPHHASTITCPLCAFFKVKSGVPLIPADERSIPETHNLVKGGGGSTKVLPGMKKDKTSRHSSKTNSAIDTRLGKWGDFEETVKSAYLKSAQSNRKRDMDDFDESSEHIIPEALTEFIEDREKKRKK